MHINKKKNSIIKTIGICVLILGCSTTSFFVGKNVGINSPATSKLYFSFNKNLASVNGENIPFDSFKSFMEVYFYMNKTQKFTAEEIKEYENDVIEYMTLNKAIYNKAIKEGITSDEKSLKENYSSFMEDLSTQLNLTTNEIFRKFNLSEDMILQSIKEQDVISAYLDKCSEVSDEEALNYYNENPDEFSQYKVSHILISTTDENDNEVSKEEKEKRKEKALDLLKQIKNGANFEELASSNSDRINDYDESPDNGGDLGYLSKTEIDESLLKALDSISVGDLYGDIVETSSGYHILKKTDERTLTFEDEKESIVTNIAYSKQEDTVENIRKESKIEIFYN